MGLLIALLALLAIAFIALLIYTTAQSKESISKKDLMKSADAMAPLGYTFFKEIYIEAHTPYTSVVNTVSQRLCNVYLKFPKKGERFTYGFNDYTVEDFEFKNNLTPPRLRIELEDFNEPTWKDKTTQPTTL